MHEGFQFQFLPLWHPFWKRQTLTTVARPTLSVEKIRIGNQGLTGWVSIVRAKETFTTVGMETKGLALKIWLLITSSSTVFYTVHTRDEFVSCRKVSAGWVRVLTMWGSWSGDKCQCYSIPSLIFHNLDHLSSWFTYVEHIHFPCSLYQVQPCGNFRASFFLSHCSVYIACPLHGTWRICVYIVAILIPSYTT